MISTAELKKKTKAELTEMAKEYGVEGYSSMLKNELVSAVAKASRKSRKSSSKSGSPRSKSKTQSPTTANARRAASGGRKSSTGQRKSISGGKASSSSVKSGTTAANASSKKSATGGARNPRAATSRSKSKPDKASSSSPRGTKSASKVKAAKDSVTGKTGGTTKRRTGKSAGSSPAAAQAGHKSASKSEKGKAATKPSSKRSSTADKGAAKKGQRASTSPKALKKIREMQLQREASKDIAFRPSMVRPPGATEPIWEKEPQKDRISLFVRDPYWLHATWDITRNAVERAKAAMAEQWHAAKPILRLIKLDDTGTSNTSETVERDIEIHGGLRNWYIDWRGESTLLRVAVGYLASNGRFHAIARSNIVKTPESGSAEAVDQHWSDSSQDVEKIFALSGGYDSSRDTEDMQEMLEQRIQKNLGAPALAKIGASADGPFRRRNDFHFSMEIELVVYGSTVPDGYLTLNGEPVSLRSDGSFAVRLPFPDRRQVLPAVACSRDGSQQRTIVVAVERNTKVMEPLEKDLDSHD